MVSYFQKVLFFYLGINFIYWTTGLYCYPTDDKKVVASALQRVCFNMFILLLPPILAIVPFIPEQDFLVGICLIDLFLCLVTIDFWMYLTHYLSHTRFLIQYHLVHHEYIVPSSLVALYAHWFDFYFNNILPVVIMPLLLGSHWVTILLWQCIAVINAVYGAHSRIASDRSHIKHHRYFNCNYGVGLYMDKLLGTYK